MIPVHPAAETDLPRAAGLSAPEQAPPPAASTPKAERPVPRFLFVLLAGVTVFFLTVTLVQLQGLQSRIDSPPALDLAPALAPLDEGAVSTADRMMVGQWRTLALLEQNALERRYHQANVLLLSRTWMRYLGFMTGMIIALIGAAFVLGKLREPSTAMGLKNTAVEANITTTSPGLVLCLLGTALMLATLLFHSDIETWEANPLYTRMILAPAGDFEPPELLPTGEVRDPLAEPGDVPGPPDP